MDPSELSMEMTCSKSLASMLVSLLHLLVRPLRNAGFGFQLVPFLHTFLQGHPTWCLNRLHQTRIPTIMVVRLSSLLHPLTPEFATSVVILATSHGNVPCR